MSSNLSSGDWDFMSTQLLLLYYYDSCVDGYKAPIT
jgi:hypothetical protein